MTPDEALERLRHMPFEDLGFAKVDHHRAIRAGMPEVILASGKTPAQVAGIFKKLAAHKNNVLVTRATQQHFAAVKKIARKAEYHELGRCIALHQDSKKYGKGTIAVVSAGTSDIPVAEEAVVTAEIMGNSVEHFYDVGVAGIHRLLKHSEGLMKARVIICVAGMEGALPSVVGGLFGRPLFAVPTSVGYGASFGGVAALLAMINSCAPGVAVVNIDNGFSAGFAACQVIRQILRHCDE
jgi:pyridinium-3,5-biscarboxylic acid mononucleotide synthase